MRPLGHIIATGLGLLVLAAQPARAAGDGLITRPSAHSTDATIQRFEAAVRKQGWVVFGELDHAAAAKAAGMALDRRTVILFGSPRAGTPVMRAHPTLARELPMRVLVWRDAQGHVFVTRSSGADIATRVFARHGVALPQQAQDATEATRLLVVPLRRDSSPGHVHRRMAVRICARSEGAVFRGHYIVVRLGPACGGHHALARAVTTQPVPLRWFRAGGWRHREGGRVRAHGGRSGGCRSGPRAASNPG